jgi:hypothetical protein
MGDDVWDTTIEYGKQIHHVGRFQGRDRASVARKICELAIELE